MTNPYEIIPISLTRHGWEYVIENLQKVTYFPDLQSPMKLDIAIEAIAKQLHDHPEAEDGS